VEEGVSEMEEWNDVLFVTCFCWWFLNREPAKNIMSENLREEPPIVQDYIVKCSIDYTANCHSLITITKHLFLNVHFWCGQISAIVRDVVKILCYFSLVGDSYHTGVIASRGHSDSDYKTWYIVSI
jgi:hypothetical protein